MGVDRGLDDLPGQAGNHRGQEIAGVHDERDVIQHAQPLDADDLGALGHA